MSVVTTVNAFLNRKPFGNDPLPTRSVRVGNV